jgi:hypothetical protein
MCPCVVRGASEAREVIAREIILKVYPKTTSDSCGWLSQSLTCGATTTEAKNLIDLSDAWSDRFYSDIDLDFEVRTSMPLRYLTAPEYAPISVLDVPARTQKLLPVDAGVWFVLFASASASPIIASR